MTKLERLVLIGLLTCNASTPTERGKICPGNLLVQSLPSTRIPPLQPDIDKLVRQLFKLVFVENVKDLTPEPYVQQELVLVKVRSTGCRYSFMVD